MKILSFREKKLKWNILILVILVMLTVAMMWLLTMSFLKQMFTYTINLDGYYKSYYLSKAWIELALTEIDNSDIWFSNEIKWDDNIFSQNLCKWWGCSVDLTVLGRAKELNQYFWESTGCTAETAFTLAGGESFALPLFLQDTWSSNAQLVLWEWKDDISYISIDDLKNVRLKFLDNNEGKREIVLSLVFPTLAMQLDYLYIATWVLDETAIKTFVENAGLHNYDLGSKIYLMISNSTIHPISFCFSSRVDLPATKFYVVSLWNYQWKYVGMQAIYAQPIPSFMFDGYHWAAWNNVSE